MQIRKGAKKAEAVTIPEDIVQALKAQPATPEGKRDTLIMCLLLDHGLRDSEIAILTRQSFDMKAGTFTFYRDMRFVKQAFEAAGYQLLYSRKKEQPGYYLNGQLALSSEFKQVLKSRATEVDQRQIDIYRKLSFAERFYQGCSLSDTARKVVAYRIRQENRRVSLAEANRMALQRAYSQRKTNLWSLPVSSG